MLEDDMWIRVYCFIKKMLQSMDPRVEIPIVESSFLNASIIMPYQVTPAKIGNIKFQIMSIYVSHHIKYDLDNIATDIK